MFAALRVAVPLRLWVCVLSRFFALAYGIDRSLLLLRRRAYGFECFCAFMFAFYGSLYFCAVEVVCRSGFMLLLLSFPAARGFRLFELLKRSTAFFAPLVAETSVCL